VRVPNGRRGSGVAWIRASNIKGGESRGVKQSMRKQEKEAWGCSLHGKDNEGGVWELITGEITTDKVLQKSCEDEEQGNEKKKKEEECRRIGHQ